MNPYALGIQAIVISLLNDHKVLSSRVRDFLASQYWKVPELHEPLLTVRRQGTIVSLVHEHIDSNRKARSAMSEQLNLPALYHGPRMDPLSWIHADGISLLDVGCNAGDLLFDVHQKYPNLALAGIDINPAALQIAKSRLPGAEIQEGVGYELPFASERFSYATCIEVIEHVPDQHRRKLVAEMRRVLRPGGLLLLRCPHHGAFDWLDVQNYRFRFPGLYRKLVGSSERDAHYTGADQELVWHHHFTRDELLDIAGDGWEEVACHRGGCLVFPVTDMLAWPFYRLGRSDGWALRMLQKVAAADLNIDYGRQSYDVLLVLRKRGGKGGP